MKILVTGSHGFIGSHLVAALEKRGDTIIPLKRDLLIDSAHLQVFTDEHKPDYIFHLSAYGNMATQKDLDTTFLTNLFGIHSLLKATRELPYKAFVNVSSSSVQLSHQTMYSATKLGAEALCKAFVDEYNKPIVTARPATVIGKGEQEAHLIPTLIRSCKTGEEMPFIGSPTHDFIDVRDVVEALLLLANNAEEQKGNTFNISNNYAYPNFMIRKFVQDAIGKEANLVNKDSLRSYDNEDWKVDNAELLKLGWRPKYTLAETIQSMV